MNGNENKNANGRPASKVIVLNGISPTGVEPSMVYQRDLVEYNLLRLGYVRARLALEQKARWLRGMLECGCPVEPGPHTAELVERQRSGYQVEPTTYEQLVVR